MIKYILLRSRVHYIFDNPVNLDFDKIDKYIRSLESGPGPEMLL